jgi:hypothetical protein
MLFSNLQGSERRVYSQNGEDGVIEAIFARLGTTNKFFVELGCRDGTRCNGAYLIEEGWTGLMLDAEGISANPQITIRNEFVTAENINQLFKKHRVPPHFDLLSIGVDGNEFWLWREIINRPRVVVIKYNAHVSPEVRASIVYDPNFCASGTDYFGASLLALAELGRQKGYTLLYCERAGVSAFFAADETLPAGFRAASVESIYRPPNYSYLGWCLRPDPTRRMIDPFDPYGQLFCQTDCLPG